MILVNVWDIMYLTNGEYTQVLMIVMLEFLIDNILVEFQQIVGILIRTNSYFHISRSPLDTSKKVDQRRQIF